MKFLGLFCLEKWIIYNKVSNGGVFDYHFILLVLWLNWFWLNLVLAFFFVNLVIEVHDFILKNQRRFEFIGFLFYLWLWLNRKSCLLLLFLMRLRLNFTDTTQSLDFNFQGLILNFLEYFGLLQFKFVLFRFKLLSILLNSINLWLKIRFFLKWRGVSIVYLFCTCNT